MGELDAGMSWREFSTLVSAFSPNSVWVMVEKQEGDEPIDDPEAAERAAMEILSG